MLSPAAGKTQSKKPRTIRYGVLLIDAWQFPTLAWGDPTLPSALRRFTSEFGMGSGGTTALKPPGKFCYLYQLKIVSHRQNTFGVVRLSLTVH